MRFAFTDEQLALRAAVRQVLDRHCTAADVREAAHDPTSSRTSRTDASTAGARWSALSALGVPGVLIPERYGGVGLGFVDWIGIAEECGRAALPEPLAGSAAVAAPLLAEAAGGQSWQSWQSSGPSSTLGTGAAEAEAWLRAQAAGDLVVAVGGFEPSGSGLATTTDVSSRHAGAPPMGGSARTARVLGAGQAGLYVLALHAPGSDWQLHAVEAREVSVATTPSLDGTRHLATIVWTPQPRTQIATGDSAATILSDAADRAATTSAAELCGLADRMISMAAAYARERRQFGRPVGSFQAVKHHLASARVRLEFARPAVYRAADSVARTLPARSEHASMAKALASDAADLAARVALQVHGAIGYTWECDLHLYMKRAWSLSATWGDATTHRARVLATALDRLTG